MKLKTYRKKRNFTQTPEPQGKVKSRQTTKPLFIIQKHAASHLHYDFRLELNGVLLSWAVPKGPSLDPTIKRLAVHVEDHPLEYGSFEGIIPKGQYGGGTVMLWDKGVWISEDEDPIKAYQQGHMKFILKAKKCKGHWKLIRINQNDKTWLLIKGKDEFAKPIKKYDVTIKEPNSVKSSFTMDEIANKHPKIHGKKTVEKKSTKKMILDIPHNLKITAIPQQIFPQLATLVDEAPNGKEWLHEIKFDGYRIISIKKKGKTQLYTRNLNNWTSKFQNIAEAIDKLPIDNIILDGELVVLDDQQQSNFQLLQNSIKAKKTQDFIYYIFDLIYIEKHNLSTLPLIERKTLLNKILENNSFDFLRYSDHVIGDGKPVFKKACQLGLEGIISKNINSPYVQKRNTDWLKIKCTKSQEFLIAGFTPPQGSRNFFGSLLLATYNNKKELIYHGNVGTGFTQASLKDIYSKLRKYESNRMPFKQKPPASNKVTWVKPVLVAEIEFTEWTKDHSLRHPSFKGLRADKNPASIHKEKACRLKKRVI